MQKITALLEQYVEWVALGIGGLFLLMMVFMYVLQTPVSDKVGERTVTLASVESEVNSQSASLLETAMNDTRVPTAEVPPYGAQFVDHMSLKDATLPTMGGGPWIAYGGAPSKPLIDMGKTPTGAAPDAIQAELPVPPVPQWLAASTGKTTVLTDPSAKSRAVVVRLRNAGNVGNAGAAAGPVGPTVGGPPANLAAMIAAAQSQGQAMARASAGRGAAPPLPAPARLPAGTGAAAAGTGAGAGGTGTTSGESETEGVDKVWVTAAWEITTDDLARAFTAASVPENLSTVFLRLETVREEIQADGSWGNPTVIKPLAYHSVPEMPAAGASSSQERTYNEWVSANAQTLLVPGFYPRSAGDDWYVPGQPNPNEPVKTVAAPVRSPGYPYPGRNNLRGMPPGAPGGMPGMTGMPGGNRRGSRRGGARGYGAPSGYASDDADRPAASGYRTNYQSGPPPEVMAQIQRQIAAAQAGAAGASGAPGAATPTRAGRAAAGAIEIPEGYTIPRGTFIPGELTENVIVWVHDDTVRPGKTYRYKMKYSIRNPFWQQTQLVKDPELAKRFAIYSKESEWSDDVEVAPTLRFFVATGITQNATSARFDIYRWQKGKWHQKTFTVEPGDMIGSKDTATDFTTGYYLVDVKADAISRQPVTISDLAGQLEGRNYQEDLSGLVSFKKDIDWVDPNAVPAAPVGNPAMGGPPPGYGGPPPGFGGPPPGFVPPTGPGGRR